MTVVILLLLGTVAYPFLVYTDIPLIAKWRTLYIETAMSTMTHQWLATAFLPQSVIDEVMQGRSQVVESQKDIESTWENGAGSVLTDVEQAVGRDAKNKEAFFTLFSELDEDSVEAYAEKHPSEMPEDYLTWEFDACDTRGGTGIRMTAGDTVMAINAPQGILIIEVTGDGYNDRLAVVKDASRVQIGTCKNLFSVGQQVRDIAARYDAVVAMNASGFIDPEGHGNGGTPYGYLKSEGEKLQSMYGGEYKIVGFDEENRMQIGGKEITGDLRDAVEFGPALILDGEQLIRSTAGWGLQPRSAIGQTADRTVLMLVVDGRRPGHSIGCTVLDTTEILLRYGAVQGCNLDGGSSSILYYNGREITRPTNASDNPRGRHLPCAWVVREKTT